LDLRRRGRAAGLTVSGRGQQHAHLKGNSRKRVPFRLWREGTKLWEGKDRIIWPASLVVCEVCQVLICRGLHV